MDVLTTEARRWDAASEITGLALPTGLREALDVHAGHEARTAALPRRPERPPTIAQLIAGGAEPEKAQQDHDKALAEFARAKELSEAVWQARSLAARRASIACAGSREELILSIRPLVTAIVEAAVPLAAVLAPFAPDYKAEVLVRHADPDQTEAYRDALELERRFEALVAAWRSSMAASMQPGGHPGPEGRILVVRGPETRGTPRQAFDARWVSQRHYYWANPARIGNPRLDGTYYDRGHVADIRPDLLAVAREPKLAEAGFRLATMRELADLYETGTFLATDDGLRGSHQDARGGNIYDCTPGGPLTPEPEEKRRRVVTL